MQFGYIQWRIYAKKEVADSSATSFCFEGGAGGNRTLVRTRKPYAFYMLIPAFNFRGMARPGPPTIPLSSKISSGQRGVPELFPICLHRLINKIRNYIR